MPPSLIKIMTVSTLLGMAGTLIGSLIAITVPKKIPDKIYSFVLELTAGLMISVIFFDLIVEALAISPVMLVLPSLVLGVLFSVAVQDFIQNNTIGKKFTSTGIMMFLYICAKDFPEGLAIGSGFHVSYRPGIALALTIALHDIPDGIALTIPFRRGGTPRLKCLVISLFTLLPLAVGSFTGAYIGSLSERLLSAFFSFAAGNMLYISFGELVARSKTMYKGRLPTMGCICGIILGLIITLYV